MKVLAVFATLGHSSNGPFSGTSNRVFDLEQLDEAAVIYMEGAILADRGVQDPGQKITSALLTNVIPLEG